MKKLGDRLLGKAWENGVKKLGDRLLGKAWENDKKKLRETSAFFLCSRGAATAVPRGELLACGQLQRASAAQRPLKRGAASAALQNTTAAKTRLWLGKAAQRPLKRGAATVVQRPGPRG